MFSLNLVDRDELLSLKLSSGLGTSDIFIVGFPVYSRGGNVTALTATLWGQRQRRSKQPKRTVRPQTRTWLMFQMGEDKPSLS